MGLKKESDMTEQLNHNRRIYHSFIHSFLHTCFLRASQSQDTGQGLTIDLALEVTPGPKRLVWAPGDQGHIGPTRVWPLGSPINTSGKGGPSFVH